jgi:basic membrane protein A
LVYELAKKYTDVDFIVFEYKNGEMPNVVNAEFAQNEGSYAAGFLAARFSASKKIAFIGGVNIAVIKDFESGFRQGMLRGDPSCTLISEYVSQLPDYSGFYDPKKGYEMARRLYEDGVDIIYAVAGGTGNGIIQAARTAGKYVIGVDSNQDHMAPGQVLTSMMKRLDVAVLRLIELRINGKLEGGVYRFDYRNGGVSLTEMEYTLKMFPAALIRELHEIEKQIADGVIAVINTLKG